MKQTHKRIYVKMTDLENNGIFQWLVLVAFNDDGDYMTICEMHGQKCMEVHVDEGYVVSTYYYPIPRYAITSIAVYDE